MAGFQVIMYGRFWVFTEGMLALGLNTTTVAVGRTDGTSA
jgi:hypothetical protein